MSKRFQQIVDSVNNLVKSKVLGVEDERFLKKALKDFEHSLVVKNDHKVQISINKICKRLLEKMQ